MKKIIFFLMFYSIGVNSQGLILSSPDEKASFPKYEIDNLGFSDLLPFTYSLEKYVPPIVLQKGGTCVGFASFYYGLSTMYNAQLDLTSKAEKLAHSFDPYFIYSYVFNDIDNCDKGLKFYEGFETLKNIGTKKLLFPPFTECGTNWTSEQIDNISPYTKPYAIKQWYSLDKTKYPKDQIIEAVKGSIYYKTPVITGFNFVNSMDPYSVDNLLGVKSDGLWDPRLYEEITSGHALCVVGYNDYKFDGAFRMVNSWGDKYGDNGFMWVKYDDFIEFVEEIYIVELNENLVELPPVVIDEDHYKRFELFENDGIFYEGQYDKNQMNGYGIYSDQINELCFVGNFENGKKNGFFFIADNEGLFYQNYTDDIVQEDDMGFGSNKSDSKAEAEANKYFLKFENTFSLRKSTSSRSSSRKR